jgi:hypothetical protein
LTFKDTATAQSSVGKLIWVLVSQSVKGLSNSMSGIVVIIEWSCESWVPVYYDIAVDDDTRCEDPPYI